MVKKLWKIPLWTGEGQEVRTKVPLRTGIQSLPSMRDLPETRPRLFSKETREKKRINSESALPKQEEGKGVAKSCSNGGPQKSKKSERSGRKKV